MPGHLDDRLLEPSDEWRTAQVETFGFELGEAGQEALRICRLRHLLRRVLERDWVEITIRRPIPEPEIALVPVLRDLDRLTHRITPRSLDHLKELVGVPNSAVLAARRRDPGRGQPWPVDPGVLPQAREYDLNQLGAAKRQAVLDTAMNLVFDYADPEAVEVEPLVGVKSFALRRARELPVFAFPDLIVCDGEKVVFDGWSCLVFNNVIIEGSGEIILGNLTKLHAFHLEHV